MKKNKNNAGFTIFEVVIVIAILSLLAVIPIADFVLLQKRTNLDNSVQEFAGVIRLAQNKTLASESNSQYGVYLNTSVSPNQYILFKGTSYSSRDVACDKVYILSDKLEFYGIDLAGGSEVVFDRLTGATEEAGSVSFRVKTDVSQNKTVYISDSGAIGFNQPAVLTDGNRVKDSRHVVFDYNKVIDTVNGNITLTFDSSVVQQIPISQYLTSGQFDWEGNVSCGGANQRIHIHTNRLNNPDTQFSVFRDRRFNNKSLDITSSGDSSGSLAHYSADGLTTSFSSIYVSNFNWQ